MSPAEISGDDSVEVVIEENATFGNVWRWSHTVNWDYNYFDGLPEYNGTIDSKDVDVRNERSDWTANYHGLVGDDDDMDDGGDPDTFTSYKQGKYTWSAPFVGGLLTQNPTSEIEVTGFGDQEVLEKNKGGK